jgi:cell wall-associated NlpC family hydrolase
VIGIAREFEFDKIVGFDDYKAYTRNPNGHEMARIMKKYLEKIKLENVLPGDILHLSFLQYPQHVVMLMPDGCIIHAHEPDKKVIHHRLNEWWLKRVMGAYRYRGLH